MASDSVLQGHFYGACAEICPRCAQECERFESNVQMKVCADTCRRCAESCRQMVIKPAVNPGSRSEWIDDLARSTS
jgi:hypothetical protein